MTTPRERFENRATAEKLKRLRAAALQGLEDSAIHYGEQVSLMTTIDFVEGKHKDAALQLMTDALAYHRACCEAE